MARGDNGNLDIGWGTEAVVSDNCLMINKLHITLATMLTIGTIGGSPALGNLISLKIRRDTSVVDNANVIAYLFGVAV